MRFFLKAGFSGNSPMNEFDLIKKYFCNWDIGGTDTPQVSLGIGDDCALLNIPRGKHLAVSTDTFSEGTHFFKGASPEAVGYKALAVNLSDLAAMGADPLGFTLALSLPDDNPAFLAGFSRGMRSLASQWHIPLVGGDTVRGALSVTITVLGAVADGEAFRRDRAETGDRIFVSGPLGGAAYGVWARYRHIAETPETRALFSRLDYPSPRLDLLPLLRLLGCRAALDISDGLLGDLSHILKASRKRAVINRKSIPCPEFPGHVPPEEQLKMLLAGGDDYELLFTLSQESAVRYQEMKRDNPELPVLYDIGSIHDCSSEFPEISFAGSPDIPANIAGFTHF